MADALNIEAARRDIGRHHDAESAVLEALERAFALGLGHVSLQRDGCVPASVKLLSQPLGTVLRPREDDGRVKRIACDELFEYSRLVRLSKRHKLVLDCLGRTRVGELDDGGLMKDLVSQLANLASHGRREHEVLSARREGLEDTADVGQEAHVEHVVSLVKNEHLHAAEAKGPLVQEVQQTARAGHDDVWLGPKCANLPRDGYTAEDRRGGQWREFGQALELCVHLHAEFTGGRDHENAKSRAAVHQKPLEDRKHEGSRLTGACLGKTQDIAALKGGRNALGLDGTGLGEAHSVQGLDEFVTK
ncbi:MAG: hypothetical protein ACJA0P_004177 [Planctomycetota bacterium]